MTLGGDVVLEAKKWQAISHGQIDKGSCAKRFKIVRIMGSPAVVTLGKQANIDLKKHLFFG